MESIASDYMAVTMKIVGMRAQCGDDWQDGGKEGDGCAVADSVAVETIYDFLLNYGVILTPDDAAIEMAQYWFLR